MIATPGEIVGARSDLLERLLTGAVSIRLATRQMSISGITWESVKVARK